MVMVLFSGMFGLVPLWCVGNQTFQLEDIATNQ